MYRDRDRFSAHFIESDILNPNPALQALEGKMDVISMIHVLHQWDWNTQVNALKRLAKLASAKALIIGFQVGSAGSREQPATELARSKKYWHNPESFQEIWDQAGKETGTQWMSEARLLTWEEAGWDRRDIDYMDGDSRLFQWVVNRIV